MKPYVGHTIPGHNSQQSQIFPFKTLLTGQTTHII